MKLLEAAIYTLLATSGTDLFTLVNSRIYKQSPPAEQDLPYVVYNYSGGGDVTDNPCNLYDVQYLVKGIASTQRTVDLIDEAILARMPSLSLTSPWVLLGVQREGNEVQMKEIVDGVPVFHRGAFWRIRAKRQ